MRNFSVAKRTSFDIKKTRTKYLSTGALVKLFIPLALGLSLAAPAQAQFIFSGTSTGGTIDYDNDGVSDGTWNISNSGQNSIKSFFPAEGGVGFEYNGPNSGWDLTSNFDVAFNDPDITFQLTLFGNNDNPGNNRFGSRFSNYSLNWTGGTGAATVNDPDPGGEITAITHGSSSVNFMQTTSSTIPATTENGASCITGIALRNECLNWFVALPNGATELSLSAMSGAAKEGFRFSLISVADLKVTKSVSASSLAENAAGYFTIDVENVGTPGMSAAIGTMLTDLLPSGVTYTGHTITSSGVNVGGSYTSSSGLWDIGKVNLGETISIQIDFTVNPGTAGSTITNSIDVSSIESIQMDPNDNHGALSASFTVDLVPVPSADLSITKTNTPGVNADVDQADDTVTSASNTTYTLVVTNNGPDPVTGAVVNDTPMSGLSCTGTNSVTITGDGVPPGSFTIAELTGGGITLETLADGEAATLSFTCEVN